MGTAKDLVIYLAVIGSFIRLQASKVAVDRYLINKDVVRRVDLSSSLAKVVNDITLENTGTQSINSFVYAVEQLQSSSLASIGATLKTGENSIELSVTPAQVEGGPANTKFFEIKLSKPLATGKTGSVSISTVYTHIIQPFPTEIKQAEKQLVKYTGNLLFFSPYKTTSQKTVVTLPTPNVENYTKTKPVSKSDKTITYGPFENKGEYSEDELSIHYENNNPFLAVTSMVRLIEVSHWGNVAVEETYDVRHTGAKLKGSFSRYDYQRQPNPLSSVKSFKTVLPASARDVYYRDEIGNISTSNMREMDDAVELELRPRFPLFGGWKTHYVIGYNIPGYQYLWTDGGSQFQLQMPFVDHIFDNQVVDEIIVKIILPEGSVVGDLSVPFEYTRDNDERLATYLDTTGRPVIVLRKNNLVEDHIRDFKLRYTFSKVMLLREPFLVVGFFYAIFLFVIIYVRLDFSISRDEAADSKLKVAALVESAQSLLDRRLALYHSYDDAVNKYKASKDLPAYQNQKKKIEGEHKDLTAEVSSIQSQLKGEGSDSSAEKLVEIQRMQMDSRRKTKWASIRACAAGYEISYWSPHLIPLKKLDAAFKDLISSSATLAERLLSGKLSKDQYLSEEEKLASKRSEALAKIDALANQL